MWRRAAVSHADIPSLATEHVRQGRTSKHQQTREPQGLELGARLFGKKSERHEYLRPRYWTGRGNKVSRQDMDACTCQSDANTI